MALPTIPPLNQGSLKWLSSMMHETFMKVCAGGPTHVMYGLIVPNGTVLSALDLMEISLTKRLIAETENGVPVLNPIKGTTWGFFPFTVADEDPSNTLAKMRLPECTLAFAMTSEMWMQKLPRDINGNPVGSLENAPRVTGWQTTSVSRTGLSHMLLGDEQGRTHQPEAKGGRLPTSMLQVMARSTKRRSQ